MRGSTLAFTQFDNGADTVTVFGRYAPGCTSLVWHRIRFQPVTETLFYAGATYSSPSLHHLCERLYHRTHNISNILIQTTSSKHLSGIYSKIRQTPLGNLLENQANTSRVFTRNQANTSREFTRKSGKHLSGIYSKIR
jgi:hypothetical protein